LELSDAIADFKNLLKRTLPIDSEAFSLAEQCMFLSILGKHEKFVEEGKICRNFGYIAEGLMRAYIFENDKEITTCLCSKGSFATSNTSFIKQVPSQVTIQALEKTTLLCITHENLLSLYARSAFWTSVGRVIAEREFMLLECKYHCYDLKNAEGKYMELLRNNPDLVNRAPLIHIASWLGITPETLSRIRKKIANRIS
jgi:CRP-like cAMP-binding protein